VTEPQDQNPETAILAREKPKKRASLDIAIVGHLRVSGSMSLEAPSPLSEGKTVVGREDADIVAMDPSLSANHFEIENRDGEFFVRDLDSTNGTILNGQPVVDSAKLQDGDRIEAGKTTFVFRTLEIMPWSDSSST